MAQTLKEYNIKGKIPSAIDKAYEALDKHIADVAKKADEIIRQARTEHSPQCFGISRSMILIIPSP